MSHSFRLRIRRPSVGGWHLLAVLFIATGVYFASSPAHAQRRQARGDRGAGDRGGAGATGYGAAGGSRDSNSATQEAPKGPVSFPERSADASGSLAEYQKPTYEHYRFAISPDGSKLVLSGRHVSPASAAAKGKSAKPADAAAGKSATQVHVLEVVDVPTGRATVTFKPPSLFENLALSHDNRFLAAESTERLGTISVLHLPTRQSKEFKTDLRRILPGGIVFSQDGRSIYVVGANRLLTIAVASGETKELKYEVTTPAASYNVATNRLATGVSRSSRGKPEVQIFDVAAGKEIEQLVVPTAPVRLQFSSDGQWLVAVVAGGVIRAWQTSDWSEVEAETVKIGIDPGQLTVSPDGSKVAVLPRVPARVDSKIIEISTGDVLQSVRALDASFLPTGMLAVTSPKGPFYLDVAAGNVTELPAGGADPSLAQTAFGNASYGDSTAQSPAGGQPGYGSSDPPSGQTGYGVVTPQPSSQPGYGVVTPQTSTDSPPAIPNTPDRR